MASSTSTNTNTNAHVYNKQGITTGKQSVNNNQMHMPMPILQPVIT